MTSPPLSADPLATARLQAAVLETSVPTGRSELPGSFLLEVAANSPAARGDRGPMVRFAVVEAAGERVPVAAADAVLALARLDDHGLDDTLRVLLGALRRAARDPDDPTGLTGSAAASPRAHWRDVDLAASL